MTSTSASIAPRYSTAQKAILQLSSNTGLSRQCPRKPRSRVDVTGAVWPRRSVAETGGGLMRNNTPVSHVFSLTLALQYCLRSVLLLNLRCPRQLAQHRPRRTLASSLPMVPRGGSGTSIQDQQTMRRSFISRRTSNARRAARSSSGTKCKMLLMENNARQCINNDRRAIRCCDDLQPPQLQSRPSPATSCTTSLGNR